MKNRRFPILFLFCVQAVLLSSGLPKKPALVLAENGRSDYRIVVAKDAPASDIQAASLLRSSIEAICGAALPIVTDEDPTADKEILLGRSRRLEALAVPSPVSFAELGDDGFVLAFRRPLAREASITVKLGGLEPGADYEVSYEDYGVALVKSGRELAEGLSVKIPEAPGSLLIKYRRVR